MNLKSTGFAVSASRRSLLQAGQVVGPTVVIALYTLLLISTASPWADGQDSVNYLLGLKDYDLSSHQPHFPGYPVYIASGKFFYLLLESPEWSLIILSVISGAVSLYLFMRIAKSAVGFLPSAIVAIALAANPIFFSFSHKIFAEAQAVALLIFAVAILGDPLKASVRNRLFGGVLLGLMLGVRLSYWPYALFYLFYGLRKSAKPHVFAGAAVGVLIWLIPQAAVIGLVELMEYGASFTAGHFTDWGGSAFNGQPMTERLSTFALNLAATFGFGGNSLRGSLLFLKLPWLMFCLYAFYDLATRGVKNKRALLFGGASLFYLAWAFFGQNADNIRHLLPTLPAFLLLIAPTAERHKKLAAAAVAFLVMGLAADYTGSKGNRPPGADFLIWANSQPTFDAVYYCGETKRFTDYYRTRLRVKWVKNGDELFFKIKSTWPVPQEVYVCDDIPGFKPSGKPVAVFPARRGDPVDKTLKIYRYHLAGAPLTAG